MSLKIVEIFKSVQGEGANTGMPATFIRLAGCNLDCLFCDTEWTKYTEMSIEQVLEIVRKNGCKNIVWTGGEPTLQITASTLKHFKDYYNCIETNGTNEIPLGIDYVALSPKTTIHESVSKVNEIRLAIASGDTLPNIEGLPQADSYYLSPIFDGIHLNTDNLNYCLKAVLESDLWKLSIQTHKLLNIQ